MHISTFGADELVGASVATRVAASLENLAFLKKTTDLDDHRACLAELMTGGRTVIAKLWMERTVGLSSRLEGLSKSERLQLDAALTVLEKMVRDG